MHDSTEKLDILDQTTNPSEWYNSLQSCRYICILDSNTVQKCFYFIFYML